MSRSRYGPAVARGRAKRNRATAARWDAVGAAAAARGDTALADLADRRATYQLWAAEVSDALALARQRDGAAAFVPPDHPAVMGRQAALAALPDLAVPTPSLEECEAALGLLR